MLGPLGEAAAQREADAAVNGNGARPRRARKPKPFVEQPITSPRRRSRKAPAASANVDDALDRARHHLGEGNA
jgi:hypothetical protein